MPLTINESITLPSGKTFLIFYSSRDAAGVMWCPDCRNVEDFVSKTFDENSETGLITYVGQKSDWRSPDNEYRKTYNVQSIPSIVRLNDGKEEARLVEEEILHPGELAKLIRD